MKKFIYIIALTGLAISISSCGKDFLERKNLLELDESNYYKNPEQMSEAISGVYSNLRSGKGNRSQELISDVLSDDCFSGGGPGDQIVRDIDTFEKVHVVGIYDDIWSNTYSGIFRANKIIVNIDVPTWNSDNEKNQLLGEALFMRAFYNLRLGTLWGQAPLITDPSKDPNQPKASGDEIFAQIATDLKKAIEIMPSDQYSTIASGHATKWAAEALMARAFLFYTGYYNQTTMPLVEGGEVTKTQVQNWLVDLIDNSGHALASDFRNIWTYAHNPDYPWAVANNLNWIGDGPENTETIFAIKFSPYAMNDANTVKKYSNQFQLFVGPRGNPGTNQFSKGWGWGSVNTQLWDSFEAGDTRKEGTILDATDVVNEAPFSADYKFGRGRSVQETGYYNKKYCSVQEKNDEGKWKGMFYLMFGGQDHFQLWHMADQILIRHSDVLLMAAELECPQAQTYFNEVRLRAGLGEKALSLNAIKDERRHELALEGLRYQDIMRWQDVESSFDMVKDVTVYNGGVAEKYAATYRPETGGFLPLPQSQIMLSNGVLIQNAGW